MNTPKSVKPVSEAISPKNGGASGVAAMLSAIKHVGKMATGGKFKSFIKGK